MSARVHSRNAETRRTGAGAQHGWCLRNARGLLIGATALAGSLVGLAAPWAQAQAQQIAVPVVPAPGLPMPESMLLEADQAIYDNDRDRVTAKGKVEIHYRGNTLTADNVTFDRKGGRVMAEGNVRLIDPSGTIVTAQSLDITQDFKDGFVHSLTVDTVQRTRFVAESAKREGGTVTTFEKGVYTACIKCRETPDRPPTWQLKSAKIIHDQKEQMVYYESARFEFLGVPLIYVPYFSHPDPSVRRKTGFLTPRFVGSDVLGVGIQSSYFWAPVENWDVTLSPAALSRQGLLMDVEVRNATSNGTWGLRGAGISQMDPDAFKGTSGDQQLRGMLHTYGQFHLNEKWTFGWSGSLISDRRFLKDYKFSNLRGVSSDEATSTMHLTGLGERNFFEARAYAFQIFQDNYAPTLPSLAPVGSNLQEKQPFVAPVIDYNMIWGDPVMGGELSFNANTTTVTRFRGDRVRLDRNGNGLFDPGVDVDRLIGAEGTYSRFTAEVKWRKQIIDQFGQVFTPFASFRGDLFAMRNVDAAFQPVGGDRVVGRAMPTIGLDYRYPLLITSTWGHQIFEPIAQIIVRPNEQQVGRVANEDAQSLVYDDTNLFAIDKFSGYDRAEGGTRLNVGANYSLHLANGASMGGLIGRSFILAGRNSFSPDQLLAVGADSGLETKRSDYVARLYLDTATGLRLSARGRFDATTFEVKRGELQATGIAGPVVASATYAYLAPQPTLGIADVRQDIQGAASVRLSETWRVFGAVRYDLQNSFVVNSTVGVGYDDDSFSASLAYAQDATRLRTTTGTVTRAPTEHIVYFRFGLRTLGDSQVSSSNVLQ